MVNRKCALKKCSSAQPNANVGFFAFPKDPLLATSWFSLLRDGLPDHCTDGHCGNLFICSLHFDESSYYKHGNYMRLWQNARPKLIEFGSEFFVDPEMPTEPADGSTSTFSTSESVSTEAGVQANFKSQELTDIKRKLGYLEREYKKLRNNPPVSHIVRHLYLLQPLVTPEAFTLFECAVKNTNVSPQQRRYTVDLKQLCNGLTAESSKTFNLFREFFALPSSTTLGRYLQDSSDESFTAPSP